MSERPPYRVPLMSEIRDAPLNGFTVASTFAGCGGSSLGYRMAGFRVVYANEFVPAAHQVYADNSSPYTFLDTRDVRAIAAPELLSNIGMKPGDLDVLDGSPPCASFSSAGRRQEAWGTERKYSDTKQRVDDLFFEYIRLVEGIRPKVFVAENVAGLARGVARGHFLTFLEAFERLPYIVEARLLDAQWLGVPQQRKRVIFIGVRKDLDVAPAFPTPLPYTYSVRDALPWIAGVTHGNCASSFAKRGTALSLDIPSPAIMAGVHGGAPHQFYVEAESDISRFAIGDEWEKLAPGQESERYFSLKRAPIDGPSLTVTAEGGQSSIASVTHPTEKRKFSIAELKRICAFPDDFRLSGSYAQQWERLGRAVPPLMMRAIASTVRDEVLMRSLVVKTARAAAPSSDGSREPADVVNAIASASS